MKAVEIKVVNGLCKRLPEYADPGSAGMDIRAQIDEPIVLKPFARVLIPTGLRMQLPDGYEAQIRPRSGMALKHGITVLNTPGTIDSSFRGEVGVILINLSGESYTIEPGDKIAQMVIQEAAMGVFVPVEELDETERGEGGFGHSGIK